MKKLSIIIILFIVFSSTFNKESFSWEPTKTHKYFSTYAAENSVISKGKGDYLRKYLGFDNGLDQSLELDNTKKPLKEWIEKGANLEDSCTKTELYFNNARPNNHFHNPIKQWDSAGLDDYAWIPLPPFYKHATGGEGVRLEN
jgi:hypothetical protein